MKRLAMGVASIAMAAGATVATTAPAQAAPVFTGGLVNVNVQNVANNNTVTILENVGIGVAAQVCANAQVAALVSDLRQTGQATCELVDGGTATIMGNN